MIGSYKKSRKRKELEQKEEQEYAQLQSPASEEL